MGVVVIVGIPTSSPNRIRIMEHAPGAAEIVVRAVSLSRRFSGSPDVFTSQDARNAATPGMRFCPGISKCTLWITRGGSAAAPGVGTRTRTASKATKARAFVGIPPGARAARGNIKRW
jgi:hypothetical protein